MASLPSDLMLEIMARTDFLTLVRCAAACRHLRRDILSPSFIRRVIQQSAPCILAFLCTDDKKPLTLVHPATSPAASFCHHYLSSFMSRNAGTDVLDKYYPLASRGGLVLLEMKLEPDSKGCLDMCVYQPMTGHRMFLSEPPDTAWSLFNVHDFVLLTEADGIGCSFMLLSVVFDRFNINVNTATSSSGTWGPKTCATNHDSTCRSINWHNDPVVLHGGTIHWLTLASDLIDIYDVLTYDVRTNTSGRVKLPLTNRNPRQLQLATSLDGNLLKLLAIDKFMISLWLQLPTGPTRGGGGGGVGGVGVGWVRETVINIHEKIRLLYPNIPDGDDPDVLVTFKRSGKRSSDVVLLQVLYGEDFVVLDMATKVMHFQKGSSSASLLEIDLPSRVQTMKVFS